MSDKIINSHLSELVDYSVVYSGIIMDGVLAQILKSETGNTFITQIADTRKTEREYASVMAYFRTEEEAYDCRGRYPELPEPEPYTEPLPSVEEKPVEQEPEPVTPPSPNISSSYEDIEVIEKWRMSQSESNSGVAEDEE